MISANQRHQYEQQFGGLFDCKLGKTTYVIRPITLAEYRFFLKAFEDSDTELEDQIVITCVVDPVDFNLDKIKAGYVTNLCAFILQMSCLTDLEHTQSVLTKAREETLESANTIKAFILAAMPSYSDEDLEQMSMNVLIKKLAMAEKIITIRQASEGLSEDHAIFFGFSTDREEEIPQVKKKQPQRAVEAERETELKSRLLTQLRKQEGDITGNAPTREELDKFSLEDLQSMIGTARPEDPIARKLREAFE